MTASTDENDDRIIVIDFSPFVESSNDDIDQNLKNYRRVINGAKVVWVVNVHARPELILLVAKYIKFTPDKICFISKDYLLKMELLQSNTAESSKLPSIDAHINNLYECKCENNLFNRPRYAIQFNGYKISMNNIKRIKGYVKQSVNLEIKD